MQGIGHTLNARISVRHWFGSIERSPDRSWVFPAPDWLCEKPQISPIDQEVVGQPGGRRVAKRTLIRKDDTAWPEAGMGAWIVLNGSGTGSREALRLYLRVKCPDGSCSSSESWKMAQLWRLWPQLQILGLWEFSHGSGDGSRHRETFRLRLRFQYLNGSGQKVSARAVPERL